MRRWMYIETSLRRSPSTSFVLDPLTNAVDLVFAKILDFLKGSTFAFSRIFLRAREPDPEDVRERDPCLLVTGQIDASDTCHFIPLLLQFVCLRPRPVHTLFMASCFQRFNASLDSG